MIIAISTSGKDLDASVDPRFGRAAGFIIYNVEADDFEYHNNSMNVNAMQGAGIQAAKQVSDTGAKTVITGHCGPKAFMALQSAGLKVFTVSQGTVREAIARFVSGDLKELVSADVEGHWK